MHQYNLFTKILIIAVIALLMLLLGSLFLMLSLIIFDNNFSLDNISEMGISMNNSFAFKLGFGLNHLTIFCVSALILGLIFKKKQSLTNYFQVQLVLDWPLMIKAAAAILLAYPVVGGLAHLISQLPLPDWAVGMDETRMNNLMTFMEMQTISDLIGNLLIVGVIAGLGEELLFRGVIQNEIDKSIRRPYWAISITAVAFALMHAEVSGLPAKFILGFIFGLVYYVSSNLSHSILLHVINNSIPLLLIYLSEESISNNSGESDLENWQAWLMIVIFSPILYLAIDRIAKHNNTKPSAT